MAKRRKKPKPRKFDRRPKREPQVVLLREYEITYDPIEDPEQKRLPIVVQERIQELHSISQTRPREAIPELIDLIERYPQIPAFYNYLTVAYSATDQFDKAEETTRECLQRHPDYLFARLNAVEACLNRGELDECTELLDHKFDLTLLYPHRRVFHISEFVSFTTIVGSYFAALDQTDVAERYYRMLNDLEPDHPMTRTLRSRIDRADDLRKLRDVGQRLSSMFGKRKGRLPDPDPQD